MSTAAADAIPEQLKDFDLDAWVAQWMHEPLPELGCTARRLQRCCATWRGSVPSSRCSSACEAGGPRDGQSRRIAADTPLSLDTGSQQLPAFQGRRLSSIARVRGRPRRCSDVPPAYVLMVHPDAG